MSALLSSPTDFYAALAAGLSAGNISAPVFYSATLSGAAALDGTYPAICKLDPGGAGRDVTLDVEESIPATGLVRLIVNGADAAEDLTVKNDAGSTIGTVSQNEAGIFYNQGVQDGTASAWTLVFIITGAIS